MGKHPHVPHQIHHHQTIPKQIWETTRLLSLRKTSTQITTNIAKLQHIGRKLCETQTKIIDINIKVKNRRIEATDAEISYNIRKIDPVRYGED